MTEIIKPEFMAQFRENVREWIEAALDDALDEYLKEYLAERDATFLFDQGKLAVLVGIGPGDAAQMYFEPEFELDPGYREPHSQEQQDDILQRIDCIKALIAELEAACRKLEAQAEAFTARGAA
jgi:hypothetical protein